MLKYMLDTNTVMYVIKYRPIDALAVFNRHAGMMCISSITLAELLYSCEKSAEYEHNLRQVESFTSRLEVLEFGSKAAAHYGEIHAKLESHAMSLGVNDLYIAAHARSEGLILVSNNPSDFEFVEALRVENWC